ncbi:tetratricopeptide repeat protein [Vibrio nigripulchritudo]|uniref:tetratricopeptide repeat protein n=1 Tax=Vibrio nigripulchritudo TaxID=28173 RepID=UPI0005F9AFAC|nr:tetratricopeptide repeat protein [Vibrio nigripulchritudo]KJY78935.1 hypothetical protein TW74_09515 [Vibrio nigripulchritudo]
MFSDKSDNRVGVKGAIINAKAAIVAALITVLGTITVALLPGENPSTQMTVDGDRHNVHTGSGNIIHHNYGITLEQYESGLKLREQEVTKDLQEAHSIDKAFLVHELSSVKTKLDDIQAAHSQYISQLRSQIERLESVSDIMDSEIFIRAKQALIDGDLDKADALFAHIAQIEQDNPGAIAEASYQRGLIAAEEIRYQDAHAHFQRAIRLSPESKRYNNHAGEIFTIIGEYDKAVEYFALALESHLKAHGRDHPNIAHIYTNLGFVWRLKGNYDQAIEYYELVLKFDDDNHPNKYLALAGVGDIWLDEGDYDKAIEYFEQALKIGLKNYDEEPPSMASTYDNLGLAWLYKGYYNKAMSYHLQALEVRIRVYGKEHPYIANSFNHLGKASYALGDYDKSIIYFEQAIAIYNKY